MQEHEYRARDKTVKKMSRDGLKEENLHSRKSIRVSNRETDDFFCATQAEDMEDFSKRGERAEDTKSAKKKLYSEKAGRTEAAETVGQDMEESGKKRAASRKMRIPESESARWQEEIEEAEEAMENVKSSMGVMWDRVWGKSIAHFLDKETTPVAIYRQAIDAACEMVQAAAMLLKYEMSMPSKETEESMEEYGQ